VKAEEYEAAVDAFLKAIGLDPSLTVEVLVQPHRATAKVLVTTEELNSRRPEGAKYEFTGFNTNLYKTVEVRRDDAKTHTVEEALNIESVRKATTTLYDLSVKGMGKVTADAIKKHLAE
jgi:hypothetical protein